ncbi:response regulator [Sphaerotilus montanus]|uniref:response regulator n=1 Tax=Sphaerotilus montanus TaxID=522889 RepID=UPI003FA1D10E
MNICLIEDDLLLGRAMMAALEDVGHTVRWWRLAADVRAQFDEADFDAVVLDLGLPDGDGLALLRAWRRQSMALPVVIVTARDTLGERIDGLDAGADDFLVKPFANAELMARLRAVTRRTVGRDTAVLVAGGVRLDEQRMRVLCHGEPVSLSPTEFALLRELLRHRDRVRTRRQLEADALPESEGQSLDVHISNLRRKVGAGLIRTVRGVGYVIDTPEETP